MSNEVIEKVDQYIQAISSSLGVAAEHVYSVLITQAYVSGILNTLFGIISVIILVLTCWTVYKIYTKGDGTSWRIENPNVWDKLRRSVFVEDGIIWIPATLTIILCVIGSISGLGVGIPKMINPEYYAIKEILEVFGK